MVSLQKLSEVTLVSKIPSVCSIDRNYLKHTHSYAGILWMGTRISNSFTKPV
jgi:hypothetical protein